MQGGDINLPSPKGNLQAHKQPKMNGQCFPSFHCLSINSSNCWSPNKSGHMVFHSLFSASCYVELNVSWNSKVPSSFIPVTSCHERAKRCPMDFELPCLRERQEDSMLLLLCLQTDKRCLGRRGVQGQDRRGTVGQTTWREERFTRAHLLSWVQVES